MTSPDDRAALTDDDIEMIRQQPEHHHGEFDYRFDELSFARAVIVADRTLAASQPQPVNRADGDSVPVAWMLSESEYPKPRFVLGALDPSDIWEACYEPLYAAPPASMSDDDLVTLLRQRATDSEEIGNYDDAYDRAADRIEALIASTSNDAQAPVAHIATADLKHISTCSKQCQVILYREGNKNRTALFAAPPVSTSADAPLDQSVAVLWEKCSGRPLVPGSVADTFARAVLAAPIASTSADVLPVDRNWVVAKAIGLVAEYRNCASGETKEVMARFTEYMRAALKDAASTSAEASPSQRELDARVKLEVKAGLWDEVRTICVAHGAGVDKLITEWLAERLAAPIAADAKEQYERQANRLLALANYHLKQGVPAQPELIKEIDTFIFKLFAPCKLCPKPKMCPVVSDCCFHTSDKDVLEEWKLVPIKPTDAMVHAVMTVDSPGYRFRRPGMETQYRLMVEAAPIASALPAQPVALTVEQREAIEEVICLARDEGLPGTADMLRSILAAPALPAAQPGEKS